MDVSVLKPVYIRALLVRKVSREIQCEQSPSRYYDQNIKKTSVFTTEERWITCKENVLACIHCICKLRFRTFMNKLQKLS